MTSDIWYLTFDNWAPPPNLEVLYICNKMHFPTSDPPNQDLVLPAFSRPRRVFLVPTTSTCLLPPICCTLLPVSVYRYC